MKLSHLLFLNIPIIFLSCFFLCNCLIQAIPNQQLGKKKEADIVIYSYDRPMQLFALLESIEKLMINIGEVHVIYRISNKRFKQAYDMVNQYFQTVQFIKQNVNPNNFKTVTLQSISSLPSDYILLAVDDIIITDHIDLSDCIKYLEETNAYGFYLRLGKNINYSYPTNQSMEIPTLTSVSSYVYKWSFKDGICCWKYPNTLDMTLYRKSDLAILTKLPFQSPNQLEAQWHIQAQPIMHKIGLCYEHSKIVNIPLNKVQVDFNNRSMEALVPQTLLEYFEQGLKIDIQPLFRIKNRSAHMEFIPMFILRE